MKKTFTTIAAVVVAVCVFAQAPQKMSYQAVIRDAGNALVTSHAVGMRISILQGSAGGKVVYTETQTPATNVNGLISIEIGSGTGFNVIDWSLGPYFIKTETDPTGGTNYTIIGTSQLLSVPYTLYAKTASDAVKLTGNQTIGGNKTFSGTITVPAPVNATDATTKAYVDVLLGKIEYLESLSGVGVEEPVTDIDGNIYHTFRTGSQVWMAENLRTIHYRSGSPIPIPLVTDNTAWSNLTGPGYCWYNNNEAANKSTYGALYNWYAVSTGNLCPAGWHVPTDAEWTTLITFLGGEAVAGGKLKETGTTHWLSPNTGATNETGFTALPGGYRYSLGTFGNIGLYGYWWSATEYDASTAWYRGMSYSGSDVARAVSSRKLGFSVRCLKD